MNLLNEQDIIREIKSDDLMMRILRMVQSLNLPDWWLCAGFVHSKMGTVKNKRVLDYLSLAKKF